MTVAILLHGASVIRDAQPLHDADRDLVRACRRLETDVAVIELVGTLGVSPRAVNEAIALGVDRPIRVVAEALGGADAHATGIVAEGILRELDPGLILFSAAADPEGLADVPAVIAFRLAAPYVPGIVEISRAVFAAGAPNPSHFDAVAERMGATLGIEIPRGAVVGVEDARGFGGARAADARVDDTSGGVARPAIRIVTLPDLGLESTLVRRRNDLRGVIEATSRPLVTTRSAVAVATLLR